MKGLKLKQSIIFLIICIMTIGITACKKAEKEEASYNMYYINKEETKLVAVGYEPESTDTYELMDELFGRLEEAPEDVNLKKIKPDDIEILDYTLEERHLYITFSNSYYSLSNINEILLRAGIVRTFSQISAIDYISFYVDDKPLENKKGEPVGIMTAADFVENTGAEINSYDRNEFVLYFANETGDKLIETAVDLVYSTNISTEKLVIEQLIDGPNTEGLHPTISSNTKLLNIATKDGICYVNFDDGFLKLPDGVIESIPVYSVVNTLLELPNVSKVQISVNGESNMVYKEGLSLDTLFERNLDIIDMNAEPAQEEEIFDE